MSTRRFFAYLAVACWLVLTPVALWTGQQWSEQATLVEVLNEQAKTVDVSDAKVVEAFRVSEMRRQEFWREVAAWVALTIIGCALLAEHRDHSELLHEGLAERTPERATEHVSERD